MIIEAKPVATESAPELSSVQVASRGVPITVTAYRLGDKFLFDGLAVEASPGQILARVAGTLVIGELVCLQGPARPIHPRFQQHACVRERLGDSYAFDILSLNERQRECLETTRDWYLTLALET